MATTDPLPGSSDVGLATALFWSTGRGFTEELRELPFLDGSDGDGVYPNAIFAGSLASAISGSLAGRPIRWVSLLGFLGHDLGSHLRMGD